MALPYLGEIRIVAFSFAPKGWAQCNGQSMPINQNQALFSLLGTTYGGNGVQTFQLPNFQGRTVMGVGSQEGTPAFRPGQSAGEEQHVLVVSEMAGHTHLAMGSSGTASSASPVGNLWATGVSQYSTGPINVPLAGVAIALAGNNQGHENRAPYTVLNFIIALSGVFPSQN